MLVGREENDELKYKLIATAFRNIDYAIFSKLLLASVPWGGRELSFLIFLEIAAHLRGKDSSSARLRIQFWILSI